MEAICDFWAQRGLTRGVIATLLCQWTEKTRRQYTRAYAKFLQWHSQHYPGSEVRPEHVCNFCDLYQQQRSYQAMSIVTLVRCITAIPKKLGKWKDETNLVGQYVHGILNSLPRPDRRQDPIPSLEKLFHWLRRSRDVTSRKVCRWRAVILCRFVTLARSTDLATWLADSVEIGEDRIIVRTERTKGSAASRSYILPRFADDPALCPYTAFLDYWRCMQAKSTSKYVWRAIRRPHAAISADSIGRISREGLREAGYSRTELRSHGLRSVATTLALHLGAPPDIVQAAGGWRSSDTMYDFYVRRPESGAYVARLLFRLFMEGASDTELEGEMD